MKVSPIMYCLILFSTLLSCSTSEDAENNNKGELRIPSLQQLTIHLPKGLFESDVIESRTGLTAAEYEAADRLPDTSSEKQVFQGKAAQALKEFAVEQQDTVATWEINPFITGGVDPFFVGTDGIQEDRVASQTSCPMNGPEEPDPLKGPFGAFQGMCFSRALQIAIKRIVSDYNTTITIITSLSQFFGNEEEGVIHTYTHPTIETQDGTGLIIKFRYNCLAQCQQAIGFRDYEYTLTFSPSSAPSEVAGRADWVVFGDGSTQGSLSINSGMMSPNGLLCNDVNCLPPQIKYEFESDSDGVAQNFSMKYAPASYLDEFFHEATTVRMERRPATSDTPAVWIVQGQVNYIVSLNINPTGGASYNSFGEEPVSMLFTAVAEDELAGGKVLYNAVLANSQGLPSAEALPSNADTELHLWAAYKKMLEARYTQEFYTSKETETGSGRSAMSWEFNSVNYSSHGLPWAWDEADLEVTPPENTQLDEQYKTVYALDTDAEGRWLAAGTGAGTLSILDLNHRENGFNKTTCAPHGSLPNGGSAIISLSLSDDGTRLLTHMSPNLVNSD